VLISAIVRCRLEARHELGEEAQHSSNVPRAVVGYGFLQEQDRLHGDNLDQYFMLVTGGCNKVPEQNQGATFDWYEHLSNEF
jgi:hypothetical protein